MKKKIENKILQAFSVAEFRLWHGYRKNGKKIRSADAKALVKIERILERLLQDHGDKTLK